eukprot:XP_025004146.1 nucleoporin-like protein 2 [Gallus gallus]
MATWESSGQWMFSCYSPETGKPNVPGFGEFSAEEVRLEYYNCSANNNTGYYINSVNQLVQQWRKRLQELKALNGSGKAPMQNGGGGGGGMGTGKPNVPGFGEFSAEEVRLEYYNCSANNNTGYYINSVNQLVQQWRKRLQELKALNGSGKAPMSETVSDQTGYIHQGVN